MSISGELTRARIDELLQKEREANYTGWYAIHHPKGCPCPEDLDYVRVGIPCPFFMCIVVWPTRTDPNLLGVIKEYEKSHLQAIVEYERSMGDCVSWYNLEQYGY